MQLQETLESVRGQFRLLGNVLRHFEEPHGEFRPADGMLTVAQQIRHVAMTCHWFIEGAYGSGFSMDFEKLEEENRRPCTLAEARTLLDEVQKATLAELEQQGEQALNAPMPANPIFGSATPRWHVILAMADHTAHHRGALTVYLRLLGIIPSMIYGE